MLKIENKKRDDDDDVERREEMLTLFCTDDDYYNRWRLQLEGETESMGVCTKERKGVTAEVLMATPCPYSPNSLGGESGGHRHEGCGARSAQKSGKEISPFAQFSSVVASSHPSHRMRETALCPHAS